MTLAEISIVHSKLIKWCKAHSLSVLPGIKMALYGELGVFVIDIVYSAGDYETRIAKPLELASLMKIFEHTGEVYRIELINSRLHSIAFDVDRYITTDASTGTNVCHKYPVDNIYEIFEFGDFVNSTLDALEI